MATKRRKNKKSSLIREFFNLLGVVAVASLAIWFWQHKNPSKPSRPSSSALPASAHKALPEEAAKPSPETIPKLSSKSLTDLFPKTAWQDNYLPLSESSHRNDLLIAFGTAPAGKDPDQIRDPDQLHPSLMVVKMQNDQFLQEDLFDFSTPGPTEAGIRGSDLRGIPRVTPRSFIDLDRDGKPEVMASVDTTGDFAQAIAFLKWEGPQLKWIKTKDRSGQEKIALWLTGSTRSESEEVTTRKASGKEAVEVIHKRGVLDPKQGREGFVWTTTIWEMKNGVLVEK